MKSCIISIIVVCFFSSCGESSQGGVVNDGIKPVDPNGALVDSTKPWDPSIDSSRGEGRVDIQQRDSAK